MRNELNLWVAGGDMRQAKLAELLAADGHTVHAYALERLGALDGVEMEESLEGAALADCVVLPLPAAGEGSLLNAPLSGRKHPLALVLDALRPGQVICAGMVGPQTAALAADRGLTLHDYFAREELAVANAVPTAEGAVQIALEQLPITLHGSRVLVIGFGRVGRAAAQRMAAMGARVTVAARRYESLASGHRLWGGKDRAAGGLAVRVRPGGEHGPRSGAGGGGAGRPEARLPGAGPGQQAWGRGPGGRRPPGAERDLGPFFAGKGGPGHRRRGHQKYDL